MNLGFSLRKNFEFVQKLIPVPYGFLETDISTIRFLGEGELEVELSHAMELGNGYQAIYGQLTNLTVSEGDTVEKGTIIGYINAPTKYYSTEGSNLYFAMKRNGEPIDPILYLP